MTGLAACRRPAARGELSATIDLRQTEEGDVLVGLDLPAPAGASVALSSFVQPAAIRVSSFEARADGSRIEVEEARDEKGFGRWILRGLRPQVPVHVSYLVRPGAPEEHGMAGPTGYRFGYLDRKFGLFTGRQIFLLPVEGGPAARARVRFLVPDGTSLIAPWPRAGDGSSFIVEGHGVAARMTQAVLAVGRFEERRSEDGLFRACALETLPEAARREALERAVRLEAHLSSILGRPGKPYTLVLVPRAPDGSLLSVTPGPQGLGFSLGPGLPTRWLSIGRAIGQAYLADRLAALPRTSDSRWVLEALPTYLTVVFSERDGWRTREEWYGGFYYQTADLPIELARPDEAIPPLRREWRGALVLGMLARGLEARGGPPLEERLRENLARGRSLDWARFLRKHCPEDLRMRLERWASRAPFAVPSPALSGRGPLLLTSPPSLPSPSTPAGSSPARRLDLLFAGRNFGLLEQCGCRSKQLGGMARRATALRPRLRADLPALALELGDAVPFDQDAPLLDRQKEVEADLALSLLAYSGVAASVVGYAELSYGPDYLRHRLANLPPGFRLLSANVRAPGLSSAPAPSPTPSPSRTPPPSLTPALDVRRGGLPLRLIGLLDPGGYHLGRALEFEDAAAGFEIRDPVGAVREALARAPACGMTVVAGPLGPAAVLGIQRAAPRVSLIVSDDYYRFGLEPSVTFERGEAGGSQAGMLDGTLVVVLQTDAYAVVRVGVWVDRHGSIKGAEIEEIPLDERIQDHPVVRARLDAHYTRLVSNAGAVSAPGPIGRRLAERLRASYVGAAACVPCHEAETEQWRGTPHAAAFATILAKRRQGLPGCYACHVTGYGQPSGYLSIADQALRHVQCESCHGPGSRHIDEPRLDNILGVPPAWVCRECHTEEHSDMTEANFTEYGAKVTHESGAAAR